MFTDSACRSVLGNSRKMTPSPRYSGERVGVRGKEANVACVFRLSLTVLLLSLACSLATAADELVLVQPGAGFKAADVGVTDAKLTVTGAALRIETGHARPWPGVRFPAPQGNWDLSAFQQVSVSVKNVGDEPLNVSCRVDNAGADGKANCVTGRVDVKPGESRDLRVSLARRMPESLRQRLFGMRGYPGGFQEQGGIDPGKIVAVLVFVAKPSRDHAF